MFNWLNPKVLAKKICAACFPASTLALELEECITQQQRRVINAADTLVEAQMDLRKQKAKLANFIASRKIVK